MDSRLDKLEVVDEAESIPDVEPRDGVGVVVEEFRMVSEAEEPEELELPTINESPEKLVAESRVPGEAEKKDDRDELDIKGVVWP